MQTIAIYNNKGGIGKTTFAVHLALYAAERRIRTMAIGLDRQGDLVRWLSRGEQLLQNGMVFERGKYLQVAYSPMEVPPGLQGFDLVIADCPPAIEVVDEVDANLWLVPLDGRLALENLGNVHGTICSVDSRVMLVLNRCDMIGKRALAALRKAVHQVPGVTVRGTPIPATPSIARSAEYYKPVWAVPHGEGTIGDRAIQDLCKDVLTASGFGDRC